MSPSERLAAHSHRIFSVSLFGLLLASASCGGGSSAKTDAGGVTPGTDGAADRGGAEIGGGGGGDVGNIGATAPEQCRSLVTTICSRLGECEMATPAEQAQCNVILNVQFGCDRATSTAFAPCIADTRALTCTGLFTANGIMIPASCDTPLDIPLSDAQLKCVGLVNALCQRSNECQGGTATPAQLAACAEQLIFGQMGIPCPIVTSVGPKYDMCLAEIKMAMCVVRPDGGVDGGGPSDGGAPDTGPVDAPPSLPSCTGVIMTPPGT